MYHSVASPAAPVIVVKPTQNYYRKWVPGTIIAANYDLIAWYAGIVIGE